MNEKRAEAAGAITLMSVTYARIRSDEEFKNGLVISNALYGRIIVGSTEPDTTADSEVINVTVPLQCLVRDSALILHKGSKVRVIERNVLIFNLHNLVFLFLHKSVFLEFTAGFLRSSSWRTQILTDPLCI